MSVTDSQVKAIIDTDRDTTSFITTAQLVYDEEVATAASEQSRTVSADRQDQIVLYLAAHFVCITEERGGLRRSKMGDSDESYKAPGNNDVGLASTRYGQMAMMLDPTSTLSSLSAGAKLKARFSVITQDMDDGTLQWLWSL